MAKLPSQRRILREDVKEAPSWIEKILSFINSFFEDVYFALNKNITFRENIACQIREIDFETSSTYNPAVPDVTAIQAEIDALDVRVDAVEADIVVIESDIVDLQNDIAFVSSTVTSVSSTYSILTTDSTVICSGASFAVTLPTAVGVSGKVYKLVHNGTSLTQFYTINTTGGQTVGGIASGSYILYTNRETLEIISNGTNWIILTHFCETPWIDSGAVVITATVTNPTKATGPAVDKLYWKRASNNFHIDLQYKAPNSTVGATNGSGGYLFNMPNGINIDTAITGANTSGAIADYDRSYGTVLISDSSSIRPGGALVYSATQLTFWGYSVVSNSLVRVGSADFNMATTRRFYGASLILPGSGLQP